jgi:hypothetical protein
MQTSRFVQPLEHLDCSSSQSVTVGIARSSTAVLTVAAVAAAAAAEQAMFVQTSSVNFHEQFVNFNNVTGRLAVVCMCSQYTAILLLLLLLYIQTSRWLTLDLRVV